MVYRNENRSPNSYLLHDKGNLLLSEIAGIDVLGSGLSSGFGSGLSSLSSGLLLLLEIRIRKPVLGVRAEGEHTWGAVAFLAASSAYFLA